MMRGLRSLLMPPALEADPKETLRWVRRVELVSGIAAIALGLALWTMGWWHWVLLAVGLVGLSPWPGPRAILRRAERKPGVLVSDPIRRRARGRRATRVVVPLYFLTGAVAGYILDGWAAAVYMGLLMGAGPVLGAWSYRRRG